MSPFIDLVSLDPGGVKLGPEDGFAESVHVFEEDDVLAINAALGSERPLLVRGEPGTGKSQLARAAAQLLGRALVSYTVNANTDTRDLLYHVDLVARLAEAQLMAARTDVSGADVDRALALDPFVSPGPLWWALSPGTASTQQENARSNHCPVRAPARAKEHGVVVLIDELDKAEEAVPNGLLDALGDRRFAVPGREAPVVLDHPRGPPLVVITTNEERTLPHAFVRRCWVRNLALPTHPAALYDYVMRRARAHFEKEVGRGGPAAGRRPLGSGPRESSGTSRSRRQVWPSTWTSCGRSRPSAAKRRLSGSCSTAWRGSRSASTWPWRAPPSTSPATSSGTGEGHPLVAGRPGAGRGPAQ